ncbi:hypothetical protein [Brevibacillus sp. MS2.2]|uniref:hypothetical protein n=1 Tax=Brevibacillus sp. MS2.2 TaxID=2738981 RepID=UPI00156AAA37|nr:hypothetical protein [Brevibacillus sp. MS2.2]NRR20613.1 hypothetical protein [Brevibacillus sp. MS2.2]
MELKEIGTLFIQAIFSGLFAVAVVNSIVNTRLEKHKRDLTIKVEEIKYDNQRRFHDFGLYASKRHSAYAEFYKLILVADKKIGGLLVRQYPSFNGFGEKDIKDYLEKKECPQKLSEEIVSQWELDRRAAIEKIHIYLEEQDFSEADRLFDEAQMYFYSSELYFSDLVATNGEELLAHMGIFLHDVKRSESDVKNINDQESKIEDMKSDLGNLMRKEISSAYNEK